MTPQIDDFMIKFDEFWNVKCLEQSRVCSQVLNSTYEANAYNRLQVDSVAGLL